MLPFSNEASSSEMNEIKYLFPPGYIEQFPGVNEPYFNYAIVPPEGRHYIYQYRQAVGLEPAGYQPGVVPFNRPEAHSNGHVLYNVPGVGRPTYEAPGLMPNAIFNPGPLAPQHNDRNAQNQTHAPAPMYNQVPDCMPRHVPPPPLCQEHKIPIVACRGWHQPPPPPKYPNLTVLHNHAARQARRALNRKTTSRNSMKVKIGSKVYEKVRFLIDPDFDVTPSSMNDGIQLLKTAKGELIVEKRLKMTEPLFIERAEAEKKALVQISKAGGSAYINKLYEVAWENPRYSSLLLEYCDKDCLEKVMRKYADERKLIPEGMCWSVLYQLAAALAMCHNGIKDVSKPNEKIEDWNTICHLDIKPGNVFLSSGRAPGNDNGRWPKVVLGDFGCAVTRNDVVSGKVNHRLMPFGTPGWFPPETANATNGFAKEGGYGKYTDMWQTGGVIQVMCCLWFIGGHPVPAVGECGEPCTNLYSEELNEAVLKIMSANPELRPTAIDVATAVKCYMEKKELF